MVIMHKRCPTCGQDLTCSLCPSEDVKRYIFDDGSAGLYCETHAPHVDVVKVEDLIF